MSDGDEAIYYEVMAEAGYEQYPESIYDYIDDDDDVRYDSDIVFCLTDLPF